MPARVVGSTAARAVRVLVRVAGLSAASERVVRILRVEAWDFTAAEWGAGLLAARVERPVSAFAVVLRAVSADVRFVPRALAADFVVRVAAVRAVVARAVRAGAFRVAAAVAPVRGARAGGVGLAAARVVVRPAARVVLARVAGALVARVAAARVVAVRVVAVRVLAARAGAFAVRVLFAAGLAVLVDFGDLAAGFLVATDRVDAVAPVRVVRAAVLRAPEAAVRRPPARTAMARVRLPSVVSLLMIETRCLMEMVAGCEDCRPTRAATGDKQVPRPVHATDMQHAGSSCSSRAFTFERGRSTERRQRESPPDDTRSNTLILEPRSSVNEKQPLH